MAAGRYLSAVSIVVLSGGLAVPGGCTTNAVTVPGEPPDIACLFNTFTAGTVLILSFVAVLLISHIYRGRLKDTGERMAEMVEERRILQAGVNDRLNGTFSIISSMISMQILNSNEEETKRKLNEINNRIMSISIVHENLACRGGISDVSIREVFTTLVERLIAIYFIGGEISFKVRGSEFPVDLNTAIPLIIVMNEIISNSLKFAFTGRFHGEISIEYECRDDRFVMCVKDDGVGVPGDLTGEYHESLGFNLIRTIVDQQLRGRADLIVDSGTSWMISFPLDCGNTSS